MSVATAVGGARLRQSRGLALAVVGFYVLLALVVFWPVGPFDATHLPDGFIGDPDELTWFLAWTPYAIAHGHDIFLTHAIDVPFGVNLANNTSMPLLGVLGSPVTALLGPIAAYNALLRLALAASATGSFLFLRRFSRGTTGPALGGLIYGFSPAIVSHLQTSGHLDLVFAPFPPLLIWLLVNAAQRCRSPWLIGAGVGLVAAAQYLVSAELFADCLVLGVLGVVALALVRRHQVRSRLPYLGRAFGAATGCFAAVTAYPIALLIAGPGHLSGPVQATSHLQRFRTDLLEPLVPDARQWFNPSGLVKLSGDVLDPVRRSGGAAELGGYLGVPLLVLLLVLVVLGRRRAAIQGACALGVVAFVLSLGSRLQVDGRTTALRLPETLLAHLPLLNSTVPARYALFVVLAAAIVVAFGVDDLLAGWRSVRPSNPAAPLLLGLAVACTLVSMAPRLPVSKEQQAVPVGFYDALITLVPPGSTVLSYPYPQPPYAGPMVWQAVDGFSFRLLGAYATIRTPTGTSSLAPPLTQPAYVQEFLAYAEAGRHSHYPVPARVSDPDALLCQFLHTNHVNVVLYQPEGPGAAAVRQWFTSALGTPEASDDGLTAWEIPADGCPAGGQGAIDREP